jgi:hypothetical protein
MKKPILLFLLLILSAPLYLAIAQDVIVKENGEEIKSKVLEIGKNDIKYKNFDDPEFGTYTVEIKDVIKIRYEDGTEKIFGKNLVNSYIGLSIGSIKPNGDFKSNDTYNPKAGYALGGGSQLALEVGVYLVKNIGIGCVIGGFSTEIDTNRVKDRYNSFDKVSFRFYERRWRAQYMMVGPLYSFRLSRKFAIDTRFLFGPFAAKKPAYGIRLSGSSYDYDYDYGDGHGTTLGTLAGIAIRWHFSKRWGLRLGADYIRGKPQIRYDAIITEYGPGFTNVSVERNNTLTQRISILRVGLGITYLFKR